MIDQFWFRLILAVLILFAGAGLGFAIDHKGSLEWLIGALTCAFLIRVLIPPER